MDKQKIKRNIHISLIIFLGLALAITYFFLFFSWDDIAAGITKILAVLRPVTIGAIIAYLLKSTCNGFEGLFLKKLLKSTKRSEFKSRKMANIFAVILTYIVWAIAFSCILWIVLPQIIESISNFIRDAIEYAPTYIDTIAKWIEDFKTANPTIAPAVDTAWASVTDWVKNELPSQLPEIGTTLINGILGLVAFIKDFLVGLVLSVFFLAGRKVFAAKSKLFIHALFKDRHARAIISEFKFADRMFGGFLEGKIIDSSIIAFIYYVTLEIMGIQYPGLHAVICLVTNIIPFFGPIIGAVPSSFIILMSHSDEPIKLLYFIIFVAVIQFLDGNILDPHIVGGNIKISPFCVIFAVTVFGGLWGFTGMVIGVPLFAVIYDIVKRIMKHRLRKVGKFEMIEEHLGQFRKPRKAKTAASANNVPCAPESESQAEQSSNDKTNE
jgi:predicted PurR-regulated permease PerM